MPIEPKPKINWDWERTKAWALIAGVLAIVGSMVGLLIHFQPSYIAEEMAIKTRWETAPCSTFRFERAADIPGRCVITETTCEIQGHWVQPCVVIPPGVTVLVYKSDSDSDSGTIDIIK